MTKNELFLKYGTGKDEEFERIERELREFDDTEKAREIDKGGFYERKRQGLLGRKTA